MRQALFLAFLLVSAAALASPAEDEAAIRKIVNEQVAAWNAGDAKAFSRHIAKAVAFTNVFGVASYGSAAFEKRNQTMLGSIYKGTTRVMKIRQIRFPAPGVAIVDIENEIHGVKHAPKGIHVTAEGMVRTQLMEVFVRHGAEWWVEAYHNVDVKPEPAPAPAAPPPK